MSKAMKLDHIDDPKLREAMAKLQAGVWEGGRIGANRRHPNWQVTAEGHLKHNRKRVGPQKPWTLLNWFLATHPDRADQINNRLLVPVRG